MDEAFKVWYYWILDGIIAAFFDADSICESNYLKSIESHFKLNLNSSACSIILSTQFQAKSLKSKFIEEYYIMNYTLRYYRLGLALLVCPMPFHHWLIHGCSKKRLYEARRKWTNERLGKIFIFTEVHSVGQFFSVLNDTWVILLLERQNECLLELGRANQRNAWWWKRNWIQLWC